jgi:DNA modification methylase
VDTTSYTQFLERKRIVAESRGLTPDEPRADLFPFQRDIVKWALRRGRSALFEDCGLGKTPQQLEWADQVAAKTDKPVLLVAPLAVSSQTIREGEKFGIRVSAATGQAEVGRNGIWITNYEKLLHFPDASMFGGIVLDESSILKGFDGKTRRRITDFASVIPYRLCATATPAPNDHMELGNHAEFLGVMRLQEMLATFFVHDGGDTSKWRLKGHAQDKFWEWVASWAVCIRRPSDLGYEDEGFRLPKLHMHQHTVKVATATDGFLFAMEGQTMMERNTARRESIEERVAECAAIVNASSDPWVVWCNLNAESEAIAEAIHDAVEITGSDAPEYKEKALMDFSAGRSRVIVTKPSIAGFGLNWQHCAHMAFVGLSDSYEQLYQATRRCWRFGQKREVHCHIITAETEGAVVRNIERKEKQAALMAEGIVEHMKRISEENIKGTSRNSTKYARDVKSGATWTAHLGDCVDVSREIESESIDFSVFSPPFASLYTYSDSDHDMGNSRDYEEFFDHYRFLVAEQYRMLKPGRLLSFHCMNLPTSKQYHGYIGITDFRGDLIREYQKAGFIYHSEVCIWKDPVTAMQRTKALGLLYKQLRKDSCMSRQGVPDYLVTMRKPGINPDPVTKTHESFPVDKWQQYASPVWMDINQSDTLQRDSAREENDERHICPLQLEVIERALELWTSPCDLVFSPFMGIGSEGYVALKMGRRFIGSELKRSYWEQACRNLEYAEKLGNAQSGLFATAD